MTLSMTCTSGVICVLDDPAVLWDWALRHLGGWRR
jgi:hypothetical protein